jgi:branched-chain amino acid transport system substrate-binding protein
MVKHLGRALLTMTLLGPLVTPAAAQEQIKIGAIMSLTGYLAVLDNAIADGAQLAVERINAGGGLLGKKLVLIVEDTKSQPSPAVTAFRKLTTQDQVQFFVNGCSTAASRAVEPAQAKAKMPSIVCTTLPAVDQVGHPWVFTTLPNARFEIGERFTYLRDRGLTRVGMLQDTTPYGAIGRQVAEARAKEFNITVVGIEQYRPEDTDMTPQLTKLKAAGIQAVMQLGSGASTGIIAKEMDDLGMQIPFVPDLSVNAVEVYKVAGAASNKIIFPSFPPAIYEDLPDNDPRKAVNRIFVPLWRAKYGPDRDPTWGGRGWDSMMILAEGIRRAGSLDGEKVRDALWTLNDFVGTCSRYTYERGNHDGVRQSPYSMARMDNGRVRMITK